MLLNSQNMAYSHKAKDGIFKLEHIRWRAIANPHALEEI